MQTESGLADLPTKSFALLLLQGVIVPSRVLLVVLLLSVIGDMKRWSCDQRRRCQQITMISDGFSHDLLPDKAILEDETWQLG